MRVLRLCVMDDCPAWLIRFTTALAVAAGLICAASMVVLNASRRGQPAPRLGEEALELSAAPTLEQTVLARCEAGQSQRAIARSTKRPDARAGNRGLGYLMTRPPDPCADLSPIGSASSSELARL